MMVPAGRKDGSVGEKESEAGQTSSSSDSQQEEVDVDSLIELLSRDLQVQTVCVL